MLETLRCGFNPWVGKILGEEMATCCSILAWKIPWIEEPGKLTKSLTGHMHAKCEIVI